MTGIRDRIKGSITALITPFKDGKVDEAAFRKMINWQIAEGTDALVPVGTTGESPTLKGLFAAGEAACWDMHGFNRLGGNSVAETVVAGMIVGEAIALPVSIKEGAVTFGGRALHVDAHGVRAGDARVYFRPADIAVVRDGVGELVKIGGVGPRTALAILSGLSVAELGAAVSRQDGARLVKVPGIGKKTAERLLVELRNRLNLPMLDPVGAGATPYRTRTARQLIEITAPTIIRANASETMAMVAADRQTKGVDSTEASVNALAAARTEPHQPRPEPSAGSGKENPPRPMGASSSDAAPSEA